MDKTTDVCDPPLPISATEEKTTTLARLFLYRDNGKQKKTKKKKDLKSLAPKSDFKLVEELFETQNSAAVKSHDSTPLEDQQSRAISEDKRKYETDLLSKLQTQPVSYKPIQLPDLDVIEDKAHIQELPTDKTINVSTELQETPTTQNPAATFPKIRYDREFLLTLQTHPLSLRKPEKMPNLDVIKDKAQIQRLPNFYIKFKESEAISYKTKDTAVKTKQTNKLCKEVSAILDNITAKNFKNLAKQVRMLGITEEMLDSVTNVFITKFIENPNYRELYAKMSKHLSVIRVPSNCESGHQVSFFKVLKTKCLVEIEEGNIWEKLSGNIMFATELFKLKMLGGSVIHECIKILLSQGDDKSLECLCDMLKIIGKDLDKERGNQGVSYTPMHEYLDQMQKIVFRRYTSSNTLSKLQEVLDLRQNNWIPKGEKNNL